MEKLIIFDCEGVLVDSEPISSRVVLEQLENHGCHLSEEESRERFTGLSMQTLQDIVTKDLGIPLPDNFEAKVQKETFSAFDRELQPVDGIADALLRLGCKKCVASNGSPEKIEHSLGLTNLSKIFGKESIFSANMVERSKPHPDLFLHAAKKMGVEPQDCIVVEDSVAGVKAGRRAGMVVLGFIGGSHAKDPNYRKMLEDAGADIIFDDMKMLPRLIGG